MKVSGVIRTFFAFEIKDDSILGKITALENELSRIGNKNGVRIKCVEPQNIHLTMRFLGDTEVEMAKRIYEFAENEINQRILQEVGGLKFELKGLGDFNNRVFFLKLNEGESGHMDTLHKIYRVLEEGLTQRFKFKRDKGFKAHITIGRAKLQRYGRYNRSNSQSRGNGLEQFRKEYSRLKEKYRETVLGKVEFTRLEFKRSELTPKGPIYTNISKEFFQ